MKKIYDLRSDTVTVPCKNMRKAMYDAEVGDDIMGEDPAVNSLQDYACKLTGKEASLFLSSGTMGNLIPCMILGGKGKYILLEKECHIMQYELGGVSSIANLMPNTLEGVRGILTKDIVEKHIITNPPYHMPKIAMLALENTHNRAGGAVYPIETLRSLYKYVSSKKVHVHMDGARLFNASVASEVSIGDIVKNTDSVTFCFSKGLGAPAGAMLSGTKEFIKEALIMRKMIGGAMRQSGVIAAACMYALKNNIKLLSKDHEHAKMLAKDINTSSIGKVDMAGVETNIVIANTDKTALHVSNILLKKGVKTTVFGENLLRFVLHKDLSKEDVKEVCSIVSKIKI